MARNEYTGVFLDKATRRYRAKHSKTSLGYYATAKEAAKARDLGVLAKERATGKPAGQLNFSRQDYSDVEIDAMVPRVQRSRGPSASPYRNVDQRDNGFEARMRCCGMRVFLGTHKTAKAAAEQVDLSKMLFAGGSPAAVAHLNLDWSAVSGEELRRKQAAAQQNLLNKLLASSDQKATECVMLLLNATEGLSLQQDQQLPCYPAVQQEQQKQPSLQQQEQQNQPSVAQQEQQQQQPSVQPQQSQEQEQQSQPSAQQQQQQLQPVIQHQCWRQRSSTAVHQEQEARQAQGREAERQPRGPALQQWKTLEQQAQVMQQMANGMQQMARGMEQVAGGMQQIAACGKRMAEDTHRDATAARRRL